MVSLKLLALGIFLCFGCSPVLAQVTDYSGLLGESASLDQVGIGKTTILVAMVFAGAIVYFLPTVIAKTRNHPNVLALFVFNAILGWTLIGWVASLVWACMNVNKSSHKIGGSERVTE